MNKTGCVALVLATTIQSLGSHAATTPTDEQSLTIPTVFVGNRGNVARPQIHGPGQGAVDYNFRIGVTEVTNAQYTEFLNAVDSTGSNSLRLYNCEMSSNANGGIIFQGEAPDGAKYEVKPQRDNFPVVFVSWYDAIRFANWLHNGQGSGDTETGAYTLGPIGPDGVPVDGVILRNTGARWWLPSNDEWFKAGYHKNDGPTGNYYYWRFPTSSDVEPTSDQPPGTDSPDPSNTANFEQNGFAVTGSTTYDLSQNYLTEVGAYTTAVSPYGTYDQGGNVYEWNDTLYTDDIIPNTGYRLIEYGIRGGSWVTDFSDLLADLDWFGQPHIESQIDGFRVATIPEPNAMTMVVILIAALVMANCDRREFRVLSR